MFTRVGSKQRVTMNDCSKTASRSFERSCVERSENSLIRLPGPTKATAPAQSVPPLEPLATSLRSWHVRVMRRPSAADALRETERQRVAALSASDRVGLALQLGERDLELYAQSHGVALKAARHEMDLRRQARRRKSACIEALLS